MYEKDTKFGNNDGFLGEGTYGVVKAYTHKASGDLVAIKKIRLGQTNKASPATAQHGVLRGADRARSGSLCVQTGVNITAVREIKCLQEFNHENVVRVTLLSQ